MDNKSRGLGKGLDALFESTMTFDSPVTTPSNPSQNTIKITMLLIDRNPNQPRQIFREDKLQELAASIKEHGVLQPILITKRADRYLLVAGERRWRAAKIAGLKEIPAIVKEFDEKQVAEIALIENLQRDDLNPVEEAIGIKSLMTQFGLTQDQVSKRLSKSRPTIANTLRLLNLPKYISQHIIEEKISAGHGRCLSGINNSTLQKQLCEKIIEQNLNVRQLEKIVKDINTPTEEKIETKKPNTPTDEKSPEFKDFQDTLQKGLGMKVDIKGTLEKGKITILYNKRQELESIYQIAKKLNK